MTQGTSSVCSPLMMKKERKNVRKIKASGKTIRFTSRKKGRRRRRKMKEAIRKKMLTREKRILGNLTTVGIMSRKKERRNKTNGKRKSL